MKVLYKALGVVALLVLIHPVDSQAQIFDKLRKKAEDMILGKEEKKEEEPSETTSSNNKTKVKGKKLAPPDVQTAIDNANASLEAKNYSALRNEIKEALTGVELEIGYQILENMPTTLDGGQLTYSEDQDEVVSNGIGFIGLVIARNYQDNVRDVKASIVNNSTMLAFYNGYLTGSYSSDDGEYKTITIQGMKGVITFDNDNKYELGVPLGQGSIFMLTCFNCADENVLISAANEFDLNNIKMLLGEQ